MYPDTESARARTTERVRQSRPSTSTSQLMAGAAGLSEEHIKACVFAAVLLRESGKELQVAEVLKAVQAAGTEGVTEATAATVVAVLQAEQACLQLSVATAAQEKEKETQEEREEVAAEMSSFMDDDY